MSEAELFQSLLRSATNYGSLSEYFIDNIVTKSDNFDFSMDQVFQLCDAEPQHCEDVFLALEHSVSSELQSSNQILDPIGIENGIKKPIKFPDEIGDGVLLEKDEKDADFDEDRFNVTQDYLRLSEFLTRPFYQKTQKFQLAGSPKYLFLVGLLPFFPLILLFAGSSAISFVLTSVIEFLLSLSLPKPREATFGKIWIGLTIVLFFPLLIASIQLFVDLLQLFL